jgi:hypothetical protein
MHRESQRSDDPPQRRIGGGSLRRHCRRAHAHMAAIAAIAAIAAPCDAHR